MRWRRIGIGTGRTKGTGLIHTRKYCRKSLRRMLKRQRMTSKSNATRTIPIAITHHATSIEFMPDLSWKRVWGLQSFGNGKPYFAVRIDRADQDTWISIGVGALPQYPPKPPSSYGVDSNVYAVVGALTSLFLYSQGTTIYGHSTVAVRDQCTTTHLLSVAPPVVKGPHPLKQYADDETDYEFYDHYQQAMWHHPLAGFRAGFAIGVECDVRENKIGWYINDQILRVSHVPLDEDSPPREPRSDLDIKEGEPFWWKVGADRGDTGKERVSECFPFVATFGDGAVLTMDNEWRPPPPASSPPPTTATSTAPASSPGPAKS